MRSAQLLAQLALWSSSAHAFYPFTPKWLEELEEKRDLESRGGDVGSIREGATLAVKGRNRQTHGTTPEDAVREATRLAKKYGSRPGTDQTDASVKRSNNYDILEAAETGGKLTAGIDQDGTDYSYFIKVQFGSAGKELRMLVDTGAGSSWVMGPDCDSEACSLHDSFGPDDSDTFEQSDESFDVSYGSGSVKGKLASDTVTVAGMSFTYEFGIAEDTSVDFVHFAFDGILGLSMNDGNGQNFLQAMDDANEVEANVFGVSLHRAADGDNDGEIKFGSPHEDRYEGDMTYTPLGAKDDSWAIELDDVTYDGNSANVGGVLAYIDTGTTFIFGPEKLVEAFHSVIPGAESDNGMTYHVPCDSNAPLTFSFSGKAFEVSPKDWISPPNSDGTCTSNIYGREVVKGSWLLGATFIKNVYTVFDKDQRQIGFAQHVDGDSGASSEPTKSSSKPPSATTMTSATATTGVKTPVSGSGSAPTLGLGPETTGSTTTETGEGSTPTDDAGDDDDSEDASAIIVGNLKAAFAVCVATVFALLI